MLSSAKAARETRRGNILFSRAKGDINAILLPGRIADGKMPASEEEDGMTHEIAYVGGSIAGETASMGIAMVGLSLSKGKMYSLFRPSTMKKLKILCHLKRFLT